MAWALRSGVDVTALPQEIASEPVNTTEKSRKVLHTVVVTKRLLSADPSDFVSFDSHCPCSDESLAANTLVEWGFKYCQ